MVSLKDEIGFEVRVTKEKVCDDGYYVNSFEFLVNDKNILEPFIGEDGKVYTNSDPLCYVGRSIKWAVYAKEFTSIEFLEPSIFINVMPEDCYLQRVYDNSCECKDLNNDKNYVIIFYIDSIGFSEKTEGGYGYNNISISLTVSKEELIRFAEGIEEEYK